MGGNIELEENFFEICVRGTNHGSLKMLSEVRPVVKFLVIQVKLGKITIEQIPERYREAVKKELKIN